MTGLELIKAPAPLLSTKMKLPLSLMEASLCPAPFPLSPFSWNSSGCLGVKERRKEREAWGEEEGFSLGKGFGGESRCGVAGFPLEESSECVLLWVSGGVCRQT